MVDLPRTIGTRLAVMTVVEPGLIIQYYRPGVRLDREGFEENRQARMTLSEGEAHAMLAVFPDDVDIDPTVIRVDHFLPERESGSLMALALVAKAAKDRVVSEFFFSCFPQVFDTGVFATEAEAIAWLQKTRAKWAVR